MKKSSFIKENAQLQEFLNPINDEYYGNLLVYVRSRSFLKDENVLEGALLEILQDILDAQENGETAEAYFGKQPKEIADEMLKETPTSIADSAKLVGSVLFVYILITLIPTLASPNAFLDIGNLLIGGLYWTALAVMIVRLIGNDTYATRQSPIKKSLALIVTALLAILGIVLTVFIDTSLILNTAGSVGIIIIGGIILICGLFFFRQTARKEWIPFIPLLLIAAVIGILYRIPAPQAFLTSNTGKVIVTFSMVLGLISFYILSNKGMKKRN